MSLKSHLLLKENIDALLSDRHLRRKDLAQWCRRSESWLSQIFTSPERNVPLKYLDRIADFFNVSVYQLFQPGISQRFERRKAERRSGKDRRLSAMNQQVRATLSEAVAQLSPADIADLIRLKSLPAGSREAARAAMLELEDSERQAARRRRGRLSTAGAATADTPRIARAARGSSRKTPDAP